MSDNNMTDQVAIVTGAARGFGLAISERLMQSGVRVFGWDQEPSPIVGDRRFLGLNGSMSLTKMRFNQLSRQHCQRQDRSISWLTMRVSTVPRCRLRTIHWKTGRG